MSTLKPSKKSTSSPAPDIHSETASVELPAIDSKAESHARKARTPRVDRRKAPLTKEKILDAAESLFVQRGYYGTSLRDISKAAGVQLALTHYHFGSKEDLFRAVIDRRAEENAASMREALRNVVDASGDRVPDPEDVLRAFISPPIQHSLRDGEGWRNYIRLLAQVANLPQEESIVLPVNLHYDSVVRDVIEQLRRSFPAMSATDVHWYFHFFQAAITHILIESGLVDRQSDGLCKSADLDTIAEKMIQFYAAGFRGMAR